MKNINLDMIEQHLDNWHIDKIQIIVITPR